MSFSPNSSEDVTKAIGESSKSPDFPFVCICFYHNELPPSLFTAQLFNKFRTNFSPETVGRIFIIDIAKNTELASKYGIFASPSVVLVWKGSALLIRRPGWDDAEVIVGCLKEDEWLSTLRFVAALPKQEERKFLSVSF